jgi:hypothetical protein
MEVRRGTECKSDLICIAVGKGARGRKALRKAMIYYLDVMRQLIIVYSG